MNGLRSCRLNGFPLSLWYFERDNQVDIGCLFGQRMEALWIKIDLLEREAVILDVLRNS